MISYARVKIKRVGGGNSHITQSNHANRLPNAETNTRSNTTVETRDTVGGVNVTESVSDRHLLGSVRVLLLALHLDTDDLNGLVPGGQTATETGSKNLLPGGELLAVLLASYVADTLLGQTRETETGTPVGHLTDGDGVDTLVDALDTLLAVDTHEGLESAGRRDAGGGNLVLGDLDRLHASAETHGGIGLGNTTGDTTDDTTAKLGGTSVACIVLGLGGDEEKDGALGGGFNPGPGDEALVDCEGGEMSVMLACGVLCLLESFIIKQSMAIKRAAIGSSIDGLISSRHLQESRESSELRMVVYSQPRTPPRPQMRPRAVPKPSPRLAAMVVLTTSSGWPRVVTSNMFRPAPNSKLENLTGFFSSFWGSPMGAGIVATATMALLLVMTERGPDQGRRVLLRGGCEVRREV